jgi:hypothetical protein
MNVARWLNSILKSLSESVSRIFGPDDDVYPETGVQPFEGDVYSDSEAT